MKYGQKQTNDKGLTAEHILTLINRATNRKPHKHTKTLKGSQGGYGGYSNYNPFEIVPQVAIYIDQSGTHTGTYGTITPAPDASTVTFKTSSVYISGSLEVYVNGVLLKAGSAQDFVETTIPGSFTPSPTSS